MIKKLEAILEQAEDLGRQLRYERQVDQAELEERARLGLHGEAAIRHYNAWMHRYGLDHLMVTEIKEGAGHV